MARYSEHDTSRIYEAADAFRNNCLLRDGSLLFEQASLWRPELLESIHKAFVATPDEGDRSFIDKFRDQIKPAGTDVIRLAAELLAVYFLFPSNVGGFRKRQVANEVLGWAGDNLPENHLVSVAFEHGIGSGGQGYNTRRPFEIAFLIEFAKAWKALPTEQQQAAANDPWKFQELIDGTEDAESKQLRHMLLHLLFPDSFERIASGNHKRRVIAAFTGLVQDEHEDEDRQLLAIRQGLEDLIPGKTLDFYWSPLEAAWYDSSEGGLADGAPLEIIQHKKQVVLYGPPGTGKTYRAKRLAERIIRSSALVTMGPARYFQSQSAIENALKSNIHRLQLHPAYSYEDFVRGLHISANGATEYRPGYLLRLIDAINKEPRESRLPHILILDEMNRTDLSRMLGECFSLLEDRNQTIELPAHNGAGATFTLRIPDDLFVIGTMNLIDQSVEQIDFALRRRFLWMLCPFDGEALMGAAESRWTELKSGLDWSRVEADFRKLAGAATALNREIHDSPLLGAQYEIGHTYLLDVVVFLRNFLGPRPTRKHNYLWNRRGDALEPVIQVWSLSIRPLLEQYLAGLDANARNAELERLSKVLLKPTGDV
ncbi:AAA family ATPase [Laribacter hongkongensis]|uniref:AAA family ATPase n=1 Tax=Laribacter hongkongensis TaxID=168471 RepID=UPI001EFCCA22|nr:AAA family ATPase [Laribacter hongkongensis]MCG9075454.1 AAA family ATPase [Laribacter hongkongensis]